MKTQRLQDKFERFVTGIQLQFHYPNQVFPSKKIDSSKHLHKDTHKDSITSIKQFNKDSITTTPGLHTDILKDFIKDYFEPGTDTDKFSTRAIYHHYLSLGNIEFPSLTHFSRSFSKAWSQSYDQPIVLLKKAVKDGDGKYHRGFSGLKQKTNELLSKNDLF